MCLITGQKKKIIIGKQPNWLATLRAKVIIKAYKEWLTPKSKVLDIGCGDMLITDALRRYFDLDITGTDIRNYGVKNLPFKQTERSTLPFTRQFDFAILNSTLHHCSDVKGTINEALRVADTVLIFETNPTWIHKVYDYWINVILFSQMSEAENFRTLKQWLDLFEDYDYDYRIAKSIFTHYIFKINRAK